MYFINDYLCFYQKTINRVTLVMVMNNKGKLTANQLVYYQGYSLLQYFYKISASKTQWICI